MSETAPAVACSPTRCSTASPVTVCSTSALIRGIEGFGIKHRLQSERLLTLSEDLPLVALAFDTTTRIEAVLEDVRALVPHGLITLERARLFSGSTLEAAHALAEEQTKVTIHLGRGERVASRPAYAVAVECLQRHGVAGASVLLGLDGTVRGERQRARFFAGNARVPLIIQSVGDGASIANALGELANTLAAPTIALERVRVCKRDGVLLAEPQRPPATDADGLAYWQKLVVYAGERTRHGSGPLHSALVRRLRAENAAGATALRGLWGYHGEHQPHGERFWSLHRHVPMLTVLLDTPANIGAMVCDRRRDDPRDRARDERADPGVAGRWSRDRARRAAVGRARRRLAHLKRARAH